MQKKPIRLFVSDMDGTLLRTDFTISSANVEAIHKLKKRGIEFAVATGRTYDDAKAICSRHKLNPYIISTNGTCVFRQNQEQIYARPIPAEMLKELVQYFKNEKICYGLGTNYYVAEKNWENILDKEVARLRQEGRDIPKERVAFAKAETKHQIGMQTVDFIEEFLENPLPVYSISLVTYDERKIAAVEKKLEEGGVLSLTVSGPHNAEIMDRQGNKGDAVAHLCSLLGITLEETAAIGDSMNDYEMIKRAGFGIAMENAMEEVKAVSQYVTKKQMENGVASAISYILGEVEGE